MAGFPHSLSPLAYFFFFEGLPSVDYDELNVSIRPPQFYLFRTRDEHLAVFPYTGLFVLPGVFSLFLLWEDLLFAEVKASVQWKVCHTTSSLKPPPHWKFPFGLPPIPTCIG